MKGVSRNIPNKVGEEKTKGVLRVFTQSDRRGRISESKSEVADLKAGSASVYRGLIELK